MLAKPFREGWLRTHPASKLLMPARSNISWRDAAASAARSYRVRDLN